MIATILGAFRVRDIRGKILFTAAILALSDVALSERLRAWRARQTAAVAETPQ